MKKDKSLNLILEMMSKIDDTYITEDDTNQEPGVNMNGEDDDEPEVEDEPERPTVKIANKVNPQTTGIKSRKDIKNFSIKFPSHANNIGGIKNDEQDGDENEDDINDFWSQPYVDTMSNLQKIASSSDELAGKFNSYIGQFRLNQNPFGELSSIDGVKPSAFVPGAGKAGNADINNDNIALNLLLDKLREYGIAGAKLSTPDDLAMYLSTVIGITMPSLPNKKKCLKILDTIKQAHNDNEALAKIPYAEIETLSDKINNVYSGNYEEEKKEGLSNAQAKFFVTSFTGGVSVPLNNGKTGTKDIGDNEFVGLLKWLPENTQKLRSVSYVNRKLTSGKSGVFNDIRNFIFESSIPHRALRIGDSKILEFNETIDDPINDKTVEDLMSEATYILAKAFDSHNQATKGINRADFSKFLPKGKYSSDISYSVMDYVINIATIMGQRKDQRANEGNPTATKMMYDDVVRKYFSLIENVNGVGGIDSNTILSIIPITAFFEDNDGIEYLNGLISKSDGRNRAILMSVLKAITSTTKSSSIYKLKLPENNDDRIELDIKRASDEVEEVSNPNLFELFSGIMGKGNYETQSKLTDAFKKYVTSIGINQALVSTEWNNDNGGNKDSEVSKLIGKKSFDIALKDYRILIEYQGEQHYTPSCCRGISPEMTGLGRSDLNTIHKTRGRSSDYIKQSLGNGAEQTIVRLRNENSLPNYGKFLTVDDFSERMASLVDEIVSYIKITYKIDSRTIKKKEFMQYAWEYLGTFVNNDVIVDETLDSLSEEEKQNFARTGRSKGGIWKDWGTVTSLTSRRRWYEELNVYLQQAADKQKFIAFKESGWNIFYVCPEGGKITDELIKQQAEIPYVTDFTNFLNQNGETKDITDYVNVGDYEDDKEMVAEGIYRITGNLKPEFMASNFTYRFNKNQNLESMPWVNPNGMAIGSLGNGENLGQTIKNIIKQQKRGL